MDYKSYIASIPGFPKEGIIFRDVTTLLQNGEAYKASVEDFSAWAKSLNADVVVGPESRDREGRYLHEDHRSFLAHR